MHKPIVCFGKTRWDVLPTSRQPGGAPFSVAHTNELMYKLVQPISWLAGRPGPGQLPAFCLRGGGLGGHAPGRYAPLTKAQLTKLMAKQTS